MESYLRISLLVIAAVILVLIFVASRLRRTSQVEGSAKIEPSDVPNQEYLSPALPQLSVQERSSEKDLLIISVIAKPNHQFAAYDLLQAITATGMQFGVMNIFHYYLSADTEKKPLFSLASATEPGDFNLDHMGAYSCHGLTLFMDLNSVPIPGQVFEFMLKTAEQLADDLDGELRAGHMNPWNEDVLKQYRQRASASQGCDVFSVQEETVDFVSA